ncbi:uncharacterized protein LOC117339090 [Pecten maximus]|uniref:uncharacterized protein LOC117339090 n=1 Tax=Pecten maximus TaxID=6579 RepID=UPI001457F341|nr:uncharacterized protein LOC117339090 [Pecten maximus]XP_033756365.1 uncharacterized protein LOC117339090 [Pecten maximus]
MAEEHEDITKLCDLLDQVKTQIKRVENELGYCENHREYHFWEKLSSKSEKMELVKTSLDALILKTNPQQRERRGRINAETNNDSGYSSAPIERRNAVAVREEDMPAPERNSLDASIGNRRASSGSHCAECLQQIKSPTQVTEGQVRISTENEDLSESQSSA